MPKNIYLFLKKTKTKQEHYLISFFVYYLRGGVNWSEDDNDLQREKEAGQREDDSMHACMDGWICMDFYLIYAWHGDWLMFILSSIYYSLQICMHARVCIAVCIYSTYMDMYVCLHACMHVDGMGVHCTHPCMHACMQICMYACPSIFMHTPSVIWSVKFLQPKRIKTKKGYGICFCRSTTSLQYNH